MAFYFHKGRSTKILIFNINQDSQIPTIWENKEIYIFFWKNKMFESMYFKNPKVSRKPKTV